MEHLLYDLIEYLGNNMPDIRTIDEDYGQLEMLDDNRESYPLIFPAILIDSPETTWENIGGLNQKGVCSVNVRLCIDCYDDSHYNSGQTDRILEREDNKRALGALLDSFPEMEAFIRKHVFEYGVKNPEFLINGKIADRKGIMTEEGISAAFNKALKQGCKADLDEHMSGRQLQTNKNCEKAVA